MQERHDILDTSIGYFDEEEDALFSGYMLLIASLVSMIIGTCLQIVFFWLYNGSCHPFANILKVPSQYNKSMLY